MVLVSLLEGQGGVVRALTMGDSSSCHSLPIRLQEEPLWQIQGLYEALQNQWNSFLSHQLPQSMPSFRCWPQRHISMSFFKHPRNDPILSCR